MDTPLVSIVIPIYYPPDFFETTLESIRNQTYKSIEVIISDDVINSNYEKWVLTISDPSWKIIKNTSVQKGIFSNLNNALRESVGDFIQILCQDDILHPTCIEEQVKGLQKHPSAGMIFSDFDMIQDGKLLKKTKTASGLSLTKAKIALNKFLSRGCLPGNLSPVMLRRTAFEEVGFFNEDFKYAGDFEYWVRISLSGYDYVYNPACLLALRTHENRASNTLPAQLLIKEEALVYSILLKNHSINKANWYLWAFINEKKGIRHLKSITKKSLYNLRQLNLKSYTTLNYSPFNLILIVVLLITTLNGKLKFFQIDEQKDF